MGTPLSKVKFKIELPLEVPLKQHKITWATGVIAGIFQKLQKLGIIDLEYIKIDSVEIFEIDELSKDWTREGVEIRGEVWFYFQYFKEPRASLEELEGYVFSLLKTNLPQKILKILGIEIET